MIVYLFKKPCEKDENLTMLRLVSEDSNFIYDFLK